MSDKFKIMVNGYGLRPIELFETCDKEEAENYCFKNNIKLLKSGIPGEVISIHPEYQYFRKITGMSKTDD